MNWRHQLLAAAAGTACLAGITAAQARPPAQDARGVRWASGDEYSALYVDGAPFFVHGAAFPYSSLPADLWERSLQEYRAMGINTVELRIPWNWHEVRAGEFDFEGRSNPRRNLRKLLRLVTEKELKAIVRVPVDLPGWKNGGTPEWLVGAEVQALSAGARSFDEALWKECAPFLADRSMVIPDREARKAGATKEVSGPIIMRMIGRGSPMPQAEVARDSLHPFVEFAGSEKWAGPGPAVERLAPGLAPSSRIDERAAAAIEQFAGLHQARVRGPALMTDVELGRAAPVDDVRPVESSRADALLLSRLFLAQGLGGVVYEAVQDSLAPAGFFTGAANRFARVDVALDVNASRGPGARSIVRNGSLAEEWGEFLATAQKRADIAVVARPADEAARQGLQRLGRAAALADLSLSYARMEDLTQYPLVALPVHESGELVEGEQHGVANYVQGGGTLVVFPRRPAGAGYDPLWQAAEIEPGVRRVGKGLVVELNSDPFAWVRLDGSTAENRAHPQAEAAKQELRRWLQWAHTRPVVRRAPSGSGPLVIAQLVPRRGSGRLGARSAAVATGLLAVTNLGSDPAEEQLEILPPTVSAKGPSDAAIALAVTVPPRESLLLPLRTRLCTAAGKKPCEDEIVVAGAEFLLAQREGKTLELTFYAPTRAVVRLRMAEQPSRVRTEEMSVDGLWTPATRQFEFTLPRAPAPDYIRVARIQLPYQPHVPEKPAPEKIGRRDYDFAVADGIRFPLAQDTALETYPPLILLKGDRTGRMVLRGKNYDVMGRSVEIRVEGPIRGNDEIGLDPGELGFERVDLRPANGSNKAEPGYLEGQIQARSGRDPRSMPVSFVAVGEKDVVPYQFDFDRDGAPEWTLEDDHLRVVTSPENGGRIVALVDKESGLSLTTSLGLLQDEEVPATAGAGPLRRLAGTPYSAAWVPAEEGTSLRLAATPGPELRIEKTIRVIEKQAFEVKYRWSGAMPNQRMLASVGSVPVTLHGDNTTRFCWEKSTTAGEGPAPSGAPEIHCEVFAPGRRPVQVPDGIGHLEVRTPGSFALRIEWEKGRMLVLMKNYSAQLRLEFPRAEDSAETQENVMRYRAVVVE
jgi:hypothetical protein